MGRCIGRYVRSLDEKNRVTLPSKLRKALMSPDEQSVVMLPGHEGCIYVHSVKRFVEEEAGAISGGATASREQRQMRRSMAAAADEQDVDGQGRFILSDQLRDHAGIRKKGRMVFLGVMTFVEIWSQERYRENVEPLLGRLDELTAKYLEEDGE